MPEKGKTFAGEVREETVAWSKDTYQLLKQAEQGKVKSYVQDIALAVLDCKETATSRETFIRLMNERGYGVELAREYLNMGYYIGIGGVLTFKNAKKLIEVAEYAPLDRIVLETDCPYLAPVPNRGKRNFSGNLPYVVEKLAEIKGVSAEEIIRGTAKNARALYRITE